MPRVLDVLLLFSAIFIAFLLFYSLRPAKKSRFLLVGPSNSGKTAFFTQLQYNKIYPTQTSQKPNIGLIKLSSNREVEVIDIPGHPKLISELDTYTVPTTPVLFFLDSSNFSKSISVVSDYLYQTLKRYRSILVAANKSELFTALPVEKIESILQAEINELAEREKEQEDVELGEWTVIKGSVSNGDTKEWIDWVETRL
ncbi:Signal recognition particle receptor subunit beta [Neolecta irregularis DAH-3]|uniref:Signal recognition particle receptor subunit beta n=1 Tax=Neolecta irregularis (strain DAH-3) TaxID=1198029 RepID=A0A1U7LKV4_NEOID|nr:Signal recognition particle receptor subunit beta [Neolecta irregularis DAH-3]|eukprot:OLL23268.1 Signal recognition particle receptor subunit beta [Neolecta irregularis DAH-3]